MPQPQIPAPGLQSVADIIDFVANSGLLGDNFEVRFYARPFMAPGRKRTGFVAAVARCHISGAEVRVPMPPCSDFFGAELDGADVPPSNIAALDGAVATPDGTVRLRPSEAWPQGISIKNVQFRAAPLDHSFSDIEHAVVLLALRYIGAESACFRQIATDDLPGAQMLDYSRVSRIKIERLKPILTFIEHQLRELLASDCLTHAMQEEYDVWRRAGSLRNAIERTLKRSGMRPSREPITGRPILA